MRFAFAFLISTFLSFLPPQWRRWWRHAESEEWYAPTAVSSGLQFLTFSFLYVYGYFIYRAWRIQLQLDMTPDAAADPAFRAAVKYGAGIFSVFEYALNPVSLILLYMILESTVRMIGALAMKTSIGTLPLHLIAIVHQRLSKRRAQRALGPVVTDLVQRGDGTVFDLRIHSSRPKENWDRLMTIFYQDELYEVAGEENGEPPRRFVYLLRKMPPGKVVRGMHHYRPDEVLPPDSRAR